VLYPVALTGVGKIAFADKAEGSLIRKDGKLLVLSDRTSFQLATVFLGASFRYRPYAKQPACFQR
jgi:K+-transporting ATPase c subunit